MKNFCSVLCAVALLLSISGCSKTSNTSVWTESYEITGTEDTQMWVLKYDDFMVAFNNLIADDNIKLDYLKECDDTSSSCMLTENGESWKILLKIFSQGDSDRAKFKKNPDVKSWVGNIESVELSLYSDNEETAKENGIYVRNLISFFTPGAEKDVEDNIGLYGNPDPKAVINENISRVACGNVVYTYVYGQDYRFIVEPHIEDWPEEESAPNVVRPD